MIRDDGRAVEHRSFYGHHLLFVVNAEVVQGCASRGHLNRLATLVVDLSAELKRLARGHRIGGVEGDLDVGPDDGAFGRRKGRGLLVGDDPGCRVAPDQKPDQKGRYAE